MSEKLAFIFPGQGSQKIGMGQDIIEKYPSAAVMMENASNTLNIDLKKLCWQGPETQLNKTRNTQPAIFIISMIIDSLLKENEIKPDVVAGHSLGEYSAFTASGAFSFIDGLKAVRERGIIMDEISPENRGQMAAIIGMDIDKVKSLCGQSNGICELANDNCPGQAVISGESEAVEKITELAKSQGAKKVVKLNVSGPFHSSLMKPARQHLQEVLAGIDINRPRMPVVANVSADYVSEPEKIREMLLSQLTKTVRWTASMKLLIKQDITTFIEVGPGRVLKGLMRRIDRSVKVYSTYNLKQLEKVIEKFS
ncbi:MAG: ACP S-malonyltransferase [Halanaerobiales bacterium]